MGPRANFACLSPKCATDTGAAVYELPVGAQRCPVCGSKRIRRLFDAVNVASGQARATDAFLAQTSLPAQADAAAEARRQAAERQKTEDGMTFHGPSLRAAGGSAAGALGQVQAFPGAALYSRGGYDPAFQQHVPGSLGVLKSLPPLRPRAVKE